MKPEPDLDGELHSTSSCGDNQLICLKEAEESPLTRYPVLKTQNELSFVSVHNQLHE
jgi:hypothetical protein